ncbi:neurabin-1 [Notothenia coriiceps]|uniref:Neurabin-1 n=1 Tax=Notothenia coriiceps TaxID=8208 RepID=A0A6I9NEC6_9TELE|nr:PREDICTED: neurabin-1-like [Notothenia coriiceps]
MIKAESKGGERTLRSASPHRNAYKSDFHTIKCTFDGSKSEGDTKSYANGSSDTREDSRGRPFGNRVNKIKNIFLQMDGQQQECQEVKVTPKPDVAPVSPVVPEAPVSPPKLQLPVSPPRANLNSATSPESQHLDKPPKGEDVEIDKVALAEKFSSTRKLFERGIKEQPAAEKQSPSRVVNRLSLGSASDEGKSTRRVSGSSEIIIKSEQTPTSTDKCQLEGKVNGEKKHVSRVSLNAGPISKRLDNYMVENDLDETNTAAAKQHSTTEHLLSSSPTRDNSQKSTSTVKDATNSTPVTVATNKNTSQTTCVTNKSTVLGSITPVSHGFKRSSSSSDGFSRASVGGDEGKSHSSPPGDVKQPSPSAVGFQNTNRVKYPEKARSNDTVVDSPARDKPSSQTSALDSRGVGVVRAELVVVQNESSESEENDDENVEDNVFEEQKVQSPKDNLLTDMKRTSSPEKQNCKTARVLAREVSKETQRIEETVGEGRVLEDSGGKGLKRDRQEEEDDDDNQEEDEEVAEEESELEEQVGQSILDRASPVVYGIENAAFVDDRDVDQVLREEEEEEEEDQMYGDYDDCYEMMGLSDEEEPPPKRKINFSTGPIQVFSTFSNEDYDRRNDDVDPVAASAEYELEKRVEKMDVFPVEIEKAQPGNEQLAESRPCVTILLRWKEEPYEEEEEDGVEERILCSSFSPTENADLYELPDSEALFLPSNMDSSQMVFKFKELQLKHGIVAAEINQLKEKLRLSGEDRSLWEARESALELKMEESNNNTQKFETYWLEAQSLCKVVNEQLAETQAQQETLDKKYNKAKKLLKDYQQKEIDFVKKEEELKKVLDEKDKWYKDQLGSLQNRIALLESGVERHSGPGSGADERLIDPDPVTNTQSVDSIPEQDWSECVPETERLDTSAHRAKGLLAQKAKRQLPSRSKLKESLAGASGHAQDSEEDEDQEEQESPRRRRSIQESLSLPVPVCYPGNGQKGDPGERRDGSRSKAELSQGESAESSGSPSLSSPKDISSPHSPSGLMRNVKKREPKGKNKDSKEDLNEVSSAGKPKRRFPDFGGLRKSGGKGKKHDKEAMRASLDSRGSAEILEESGGNISPADSMTSIPTCMPFSWFGDKDRDREPSSSSSSLPYAATETSSEQSQDRKNKTNLSWSSLFSRSLDLSFSVIDDSSAASPSTELSGLVAEPNLSGRSHTLIFSSSETLDDEPITTGKEYQWQNRPVSEWTNQQVCHWLMGMNMDQYTPEFTAKGVDGQQLLNLDSDRLKALGVSSQSDRSNMKKKLKDMRKAQEKMEKQKEKKEKEVRRSGKLPVSPDSSC